jgi:hypothetical protein
VRLESGDRKLSLVGLSELLVQAPAMRNAAQRSWRTIKARLGLQGRLEVLYHTGNSGIPMKALFNILSALTLLSTVVVVDVFGANLGRTPTFPSVVSNCSDDVPVIPPEKYFPSYGPAAIVGMIDLFLICR